MYIFPPSVDCKRLSPLARLPSSKFLHRVAFHTSFSTAYFLICQPETAQKSYDAHPPQEKAIPMGRQWHIMEHKPLGIYDLQHAQRPQAAASQLLMYEVRRRRLTPPMYDVRLPSSRALRGGRQETVISPRGFGQFSTSAIGRANFKFLWVYNAVKPYFS